MWLFVLSILLITTPIVHGSEESQLAIKELHYEISKVAREVQELYVEPDTAQIALDEKTKKTLEEYIQMEISSGLPEQVELLDLKDKADDKKENKLLDVVVRELKAIEETKEAKIYMNKEDLKDIIEGLGDYHLIVLKLRHDISISEKNDRPVSNDALDRTKKFLKLFKDIYEEFVEELKKITSDLPEIDYIALDFLGVMKSEIAEGKENSEEIRKLKEEFDLSQKVLLIKGEIKVMEKLRDCEAIQKLLDFMEKIKASFESIKGSGLDHFEWKISYFSQKWIPIQNYLKNLKFPTGDLTESLTKIEECLQSFDFSMDFSTEETESVKLEEAFKDVRVKKDNYFDIIKGVEHFKTVTEPIESIMKWFESEPKDWDEFKKNLMEIEMMGNYKLM
ncbi:hypothetical protein CAEBREN_14505 [Caenorhabditis brenneri]|uniref:Domain of unknown function WSN domain-containing protein n=1 Tax=Caenorhabditis brenneri TaxID=135651 RepID=G0NC17_CAEBE|nr:hypothetical protein CAEBREN_14505 [Caenorhabditis brenneri]